jgi:hypothetical protein
VNRYDEDSSDDEDDDNQPSPLGKRRADDASDDEDGAPPPPPKAHVKRMSKHVSLRQRALIAAAHLTGLPILIDYGA